MDILELEPIVRRMQEIADEANVKRANFKLKKDTNLEEQSLGEVLGAGKCLAILVELYPDEMNELTAVVE